MRADKASGQVVAYARVIELATDEAAPGAAAGYYLGGVLVDPAWRGRGIATALTRARLRWAFARTRHGVLVTGGRQCRLAASARSPRFPGNQALRGRTVRSQRGRAVATTEDGGLHRRRVNPRVDPLAAGAPWLSRASNVPVERAGSTVGPPARDTHL